MIAKLLLSQIATKSTLIKNSGSYPVVISLVAFIGTNNTKKYKNLAQAAPPRSAANPNNSRA